MAGTITHSWDGTILTITSDSGTSSMDLKGGTGDTGPRGPQGAAGVTIGSGGSVDLTGYATEEYVNNAIENAALSGVDLTDYAKKTDIPSLTGYATETYVNTKISEAQLGGTEVDLSAYALKTDIPTTVSSFTNDAGYATTSYVDNAVAGAGGGSGGTGTTTCVGKVGTGTNSVILNDTSNNKASASYSLATGKGTTASGVYSEAHGCNTKAIGNYSYAHGDTSQATADYSYADGYNSIASGVCSYAQGESVLASSKNQHVFGIYNIEDKSSKYQFIVGNGNSTARSNSFTIDYNGNAWFAGNVTTGSGKAQLATVAYVDSVAGSGSGSVDLSDYYTKTEVDTAIANAQLEGAGVDLSAYATKEYVNNLVGEDPTSVQINSALGNYYTKTQVDGFGYQTEAQVTALINAALGVIENGSY